MSSRPVVGVTTYSENARWPGWARPAALLPRVYVDSVTRAGGVPVLLPPHATDVAGSGVAGAAEVVAAMDAIVLSGGADVDPAHYNEPRGRRTVSRPERDEWEFAVLAAALEQRKPVLAVCRGLQLLNVACGGTLHQHLPDVLDGSTAHLPETGTFGTVEVRLTPASRLAGVVGRRLTVHCHHHQAVKTLGDGLGAAAWAIADETIEAVEHFDHEFVVGVQWHPEEDAADARLFRALVRAATRG